MGCLQAVTAILTIMKTATIPTPRTLTVHLQWFGVTAIPQKRRASHQAVLTKASNEGIANDDSENAVSNAREEFL